MSMRAWRIHEYGGAERMRLDDIPIPQPGADQIVIKIAAASVNPVDWKIREGWLAKTFPMDLPRVLGRDGAGTIVALGATVSGFKVGDRVIGVTSPGTDGTHAEYVALSAAACAPFSSALTPADATCLGIAGLSAYIPLIEDAKLASGQTVLVHAGAGGVGGIAIQIAKHLGANVIATCGPANIDYVKSLGAHRVLDYTRDSIDAVAGECDVVLDTMGGEIHNQSYVALKPGGIQVGLSAAPIPPIASGMKRTDVRTMQSAIRPTRERLERLIGMVDAGVIRPQVGCTMALAEAQAAYSLSQGGHVRGKIVLMA